MDSGLPDDERGGKRTFREGGGWRSAVSVLMTLRVQGDPKAIEAAEAETLTTITDRARKHGLISHHFFGTDTEILVVDEWPDEESFRSFFEEASPDIMEMMDRAGVTTRPEPEFWRHLDVKDDIG
jgi:hypothetical protein